MSKFQVYVIHSTKPITHLSDALVQCGGFDYMGIIYKSMRSHGSRSLTKEETKKTIVFCEERTIRQLESAYPEFKGKVSDYNWESFPLPDSKMGETWDLHISGVPNDCTDKEAENFVKDSLKCILSEKETVDGQEVVNFKVEFPIRSRETGEISGFGKVVFGEHVNRETIKLCKIILHNTPRSFKTGERRMVSCIWHRDPKHSAVIHHSVYSSYDNRRQSGFQTVQRARPASIMKRPVSDTVNIPTVSTSSNNE